MCVCAKCVRMYECGMCTSVLMESIVLKPMDVLFQYPGPSATLDPFNQVCKKIVSACWCAFVHLCVRVCVYVCVWLLCDWFRLKAYVYECGKYTSVCARECFLRCGSIKTHFVFMLVLLGRRAYSQLRHVCCRTIKTHVCINKKYSLKGVKWGDTF